MYKIKSRNGDQIVVKNNLLFFRFNELLARTRGFKLKIIILGTHNVKIKPIIPQYWKDKKSNKRVTPGDITCSGIITILLAEANIARKKIFILSMPYNKPIKSHTSLLTNDTLESINNKK